MADNKSTAGKPLNKSAVFQQVAEETGLSRKQVASVFDALTGAIKTQLGKKGSGVFVIPGLLKLRLVRKPATKARPGINPFTKEPTTIKAKPARNVVKAQALKALKDMVK